MIQRNKIQENVFYDIRSKIKYFTCNRSLRTKQRCWILVDLVSKRFVNKKKRACKYTLPFHYFVRREFSRTLSFHEEARL